MAKIARIWDGTQWVELASSLVNYPDQTGNSGKFLTTDGSVVSWSVPSITGSSLNVPDTLVARDSDSSFDVSSIDFDTTANSVSTIGRLNWDDGEGTLNLGLKGGNVNVSIGQEMVALCYNGSGSDLSDGQVVYIQGAQGQKPNITLASASSESTSSKTFGIVTEPILSGEEGFVTTFGIVNNVNTLGFTEGAALWLSTTPGEYTETEPTSPDHVVFIGYCLKTSENAGRIFVNPQNGYEIEELHNVLISGVADNNVLSYDAATGLWKNQSLIDAIQEIDGIGTGIDSDLLDGQHGSYYLNTSSTAQTKVGDLTITGNLTVNGTTTTLNSTVIAVDDINIELGAIDTPTDITAEGGGITLKGDTDKTISWIGTTASWTLSENLDLASGKIIKIAGSPVLSATQYAGNAATVTNGLYASESYSDPSWISSIHWEKISNTPVNIAGYGINPLTLKQDLSIDQVENIAISGWNGSTNIVTLGTISTGEWNGSVIDETYIHSSIARLSGPTFTGEVILPGTTSIGDVSNIEISYLDGVTSAIQTQLDGKLTSSVASTTYAPLNSPTFSGSVDFTSASVIGIDALPSQSGNSGKYLTTDGTNALWEELNGSKYSADAPASPEVGDIWIESDVDIAAFDPHQYVRWTDTVSSSQSLFSGISSTGVLLEYNPGFEQVFLNGVLLVRNVDYSANDGVTISLTSPVNSGDVFELVSLNALNSDIISTSILEQELLTIMGAL